MSMPHFFVLARVVGSDGAFPKWQERLVPLCEATKNEPYSTSYYWCRDVDGEPDTLWGLEGYAHPIGFFVGHTNTEVFKREMKLVEEQKLLRNVQGLGSPDYDIHYFDMFGGFLSRKDDRERDAKDSFVVVVHFWAHDGKRKQLLRSLTDFADRIREREEGGGAIKVQSFAVFRESLEVDIASLYIRTRARQDWESLEDSEGFRNLVKDAGNLTTRREFHRSQAFNGHIDQTPQQSIDT